MPPKIDMDVGKVDFATSTLSSDGAGLDKKWNHDIRTTYDLGYGKNDYDKLVDALLSYYRGILADIVTVANPLPGQLIDLAATGRVALHEYLDADHSAAESFHR